MTSYSVTKTVTIAYFLNAADILEVLNCYELMINAYY